MTSGEKWDMLKAAASRYEKEGLRYGQSLMCALHDIDLELYIKTTGTGADCFYDDRKSMDFAVEVMSYWCENK